MLEFFQQLQANKYELMTKAEQGDALSAIVAKYLIDEEVSVKSVNYVIPIFQKLKEDDLLSTSLENLNKLISVRLYTCLEEFSKSLLKEITINDIDVLDILSNKDICIGKSKPSKLKNRLIQEQQENKISLNDAYDEHILNKGYKISQYTEIFSELLEIQLSIETLNVLESSRHLIIHRNSTVDKKFLDETKSNYELGDLIIISPTKMYDWQDSIIKYTTKLLLEVDKKSLPKK